MFKLHQTRTFKKWIGKLRDKTAVAVIAARLIRMEAGNLGDTKPVNDGIYELRIHYGPGYRVYFRRMSDPDILLLCSGDKSSQSRDIQKAKQLSELSGNEDE